MRILKMMTVLLLGGLTVGCYKDKGNYDYSEVNNFEIVMNPATADERGVYRVNQPALDTAYFTLTAEVKQTITEGNDNLEFEWIRTVSFENYPQGPYGPVEKIQITDTVRTPTITLAFAPGRKTNTNLLCRVRDINTDIEYYKNVAVNTKVPFYNAWLLVHGEMGSRQLGALEQNEDGTTRWTANMLTSMGVHDCPNMTSIAYSMNGNDPDDYTETERLFLVSAPDSVCAIKPFTCQPITVWGLMRPATRPMVRIASDISVNPEQSGAFAGFVDADGRFYWGWSEGFFYEARTNLISNCHVDAFYVGNQGYATLWDAQNKRFMYYNFYENQDGGYDPWMSGQRQDNANTAEIRYFEGTTANELANLEVLYAGRSPKTSYGDEATAMFIMKDAQRCYRYEFAYSGKKSKAVTRKGDGKDEEIFGTVTRDTLSTPFDENTLFATSEAFDGQLFYAQGNQLHRLILHSEEDVLLHNVEGSIKQILFRMPYYGYMSVENQRVLGVVVTKSTGKDVLMEIYLDNAGDVVDVQEYELEGVSKIVDLDFTNVYRVMQ